MGRIFAVAACWRDGQKSPSAGRRQRPALNTQRCGAKWPMGCTSSAVRLTAVLARSSVLWRWKGGESTQPKDGAVLNRVERPAFMDTGLPGFGSAGFFGNW